MAEPVLEVNNLQISFFSDKGGIPVVNGVNFLINEGEILGVVGESGCGKSMTALSIMGLIQSPGKIVEGEIRFNGNDLTKFTEKELRQIRGNEIGMIFQEPMTSLNPLFTIGDQIMEAIRIHYKWNKSQIRTRAIEILDSVGLARPEALLKVYPHQLSGGMRQRVMIAMAMVCNPKLLIADEPTTALDVTIQAQILDLMKQLNKNNKTAVMMITHDLGVVAEVCSRVIVMYAGKIVEEGDVQSIFKNPKHPYTIGLINSVPDIRSKADRLFSIPGNVPKPGSVKQGCPFAARCQFAFERCLTETPTLQDIENGHKASCFLHGNVTKEKEAPI
jgi:peptide/nickel transport system ATP-binding protein